jgi:alkylated DNA nucleotide flippase Atl1
VVKVRGNSALLSLSNDHLETFNVAELRIINSEKLLSKAKTEFLEKQEKALREEVVKVKTRIVRDKEELEVLRDRLRRLSARRINLKHKN